jgi:hypothetical protein
MKQRLIYLLAAIVILVQIPADSNAQTWLGAGWSFRRPLAVANTSGTPLTDYQVLVKLDASFDFTKTKADGSDIRITSSDGTTPIPFWRESWDAAGKQAAIWARVPSIPPAGATLYLYYGNASAD